MQDETKLTIDYYNRNAKSFTQDTVAAGMDVVRQQFLKYIPIDGLILDLGCGSGRDSKAFLDAGYKVVMIDGSEELCKIAEKLTGQKAACCLFQTYRPDEIFDGIWACSSLLHLKKTEIHDVVKRLAQNLRQGGCFYMSFKYGTFSGERNGRYFTDFTAAGIAHLFSDLPGLCLINKNITNDVRPGRENEKWLNLYYKKL
jgi:SAM-dependent methyltransferase